jgi:enoyl-CoA hydratase/carnithine racemase
MSRRTPASAAPSASSTCRAEAGRTGRGSTDRWSTTSPTKTYSKKARPVNNTPDELVHLDVAEQIATITLDSPHNRNALSRQLVTDLLAHLDSAEQDDSVKVVAIRSSGRVFCSGVDLSEASTQGMEEGAKQLARLQRLIATMGKPVVVEIGGPVRAGGLGIVAAADVAIAAEDTTFALTEVKLGLAAAVISLTLLHRMTPRAVGLTMLGGEVFGGTEAAAYGLVTRAVPADELASEVRRVCASLATGSPQGLRESKRILNHDLVHRIDTHGADSTALSARLFASDEAKAAMAAFLHGRR